MSTRVSLSARDLSILRFLSWTPATTTLLQRASPTFDGGGFLDERRLRERLQALGSARLTRAWPLAQAGGGLQNYYRLTPFGFSAVYGAEARLPGRAFFSEVAPSVLQHTFRLAEVIVVTALACHEHAIGIDRFFGENELTFTAGDRQVQPDCFFRLTADGRSFNLAFELDNSTASVDSAAGNSIRHKLFTYGAYQDLVLGQWKQTARAWERPRYRVVFLTPSTARAHHILALAAAVAPARPRRLVYAATYDAYVRHPDRLRAALFLDHRGRWQSLIDLNPYQPDPRPPVPLTHPMACLLTAC